MVLVLSRTRERRGLGAPFSPFSRTAPRRPRLPSAGPRMPPPSPQRLSTPSSPAPKERKEEGRRDLTATPKGGAQGARDLRETSSRRKREAEKGARRAAKERARLAEEEDCCHADSVPGVLVHLSTLLRSKVNSITCFAFLCSYLYLQLVMLQLGILRLLEWRCQLVKFPYNLFFCDRI